TDAMETDILAAFQREQARMWQKHLAGSLSREEFSWRRFLKIAGDKEHAQALNIEFEAALASETKLVPGALACIERLAARAKICVVSDGDFATQTSRLA